MDVWQGKKETAIIHSWKLGMKQVTLKIFIYIYAL